MGDDGDLSLFEPLVTWSATMLLLSLFLYLGFVVATELWGSLLTGLFGPRF